MKTFFAVFLLLTAFIHPGRVMAESSVPPSGEEDVVAVLMGKNISRGELAPHPKLMERNRKSLNATRFQQWLAGYQSRKLQGMVLGTLLKNYGQTKNIEPTQDELQEFITRSQEAEKRIYRDFLQKRDELKGKLDAPNLSSTDKEKIKKTLNNLESYLKTQEKQKKLALENEERMRAMEEKVARQFVQSWKLNKALFDQYGGRVIFQQAGPEPLDAYRKFLEEHEKKGSFRIVREEFKKGFWNYFTNDKMHTFYPEKEGVQFMTTPWWMMQGE